MRRLGDLIIQVSLHFGWIEKTRVIDDLTIKDMFLVPHMGLERDADTHAWAEINTSHYEVKIWGRMVKLDESHEKFPIHWFTG